jgi:two-component system, NtrC family, C4-dicarboxylate transport response regulator DctD
MADRPVILVVEDDATLRASISQWLELNQLQPVLATGAKAALKLIPSTLPHVVLTDVRMQGMDGLQLLASIKKQWPDLPVVLLSGHGDIPMAVSAIHAGAFDFLTKPYVPEQLVATLSNAVEQAQLRRKVRVLEDAANSAGVLEARVVGPDASMVALRRLIGDIANLPLDVLIRGETGSGKEVVARSLHECSQRCRGPFVPINCAAIPNDLIESELFGHEAGAFTGAGAIRIGKFEFANKGTVFLDEIESMPLPAQAKVLRVLQERTVTRVGSNREIPIDVRVISASKSNLAALAEAGRFRDDLYYRLMGAEISIPPLRKRGSDSLVLFNRFAMSIATQMGREHRKLEDPDIRFILDCEWPGNVRELKLLAERFAMGLPWRPAGEREDTGADTPNDADRGRMSISLDDQLLGYERKLIASALSETEGSVAKAAEKLGLPRRTLAEKIARLGVSLKTSQQPR